MVICFSVVLERNCREKQKHTVILTTEPSDFFNWLESNKKFSVQTIEITRDVRSELWMTVKRAEKLKKYRDEPKSTIFHDCLHEVSGKFCTPEWAVSTGQSVKFEYFAKDISGFMDKLHQIAKFPNRLEAMSLIRHRAMGMHYLEYDLDEWRANLNETLLENINIQCADFLQKNKYV